MVNNKGGEKVLGDFLKQIVPEHSSSFGSFKIQDMFCQINTSLYLRVVFFLFRRT